MAAHKKIKVIYIVGAARSGSTILDIILGNHNDIENVGELINGPSIWSDTKEYCSCGELANRCAFWNKIRMEWEAIRRPIKTAQSWNELQSSFERARWLPKLLLTDINKSQSFNEYSEGIYALYRSIANHTGKQIIVDSSKNPVRAIALSRIEELDLHIIHLVRDGRGVAWSLLKSYRKEPTKGIQDDIHIKPVWRTAILWNTINQLAELSIKQVHHSKQIRIRYEDFVSEPGQELNYIGHKFNLDFTSIINRIEDKQNMRVGHTIAGNRVRMTKDITLSLDLSWKDNLSMTQRSLFWILSGWKAKKYSYDKY